MGDGTLDFVGGTQSVGEQGIQPQPRIKRSLSLSRFYCNAPESALSEMLVFDHALSALQRAENSSMKREEGDMSISFGFSALQRAENSSIRPRVHLVQSAL